MIVIATGFIPLTVVYCFEKGYVGKQPVAWKEYCAEYWFEELQEGMDSCIGRCNLTEILLKMGLNTIQSIMISVITECIYVKIRQVVCCQRGTKIILTQLCSFSKDKHQEFSLKINDPQLNIGTETQCPCVIKPLPNDKVLDLTKLKALADDILNIDKMLISSIMVYFWSHSYNLILNFIVFNRLSNI